MLRVVLLHDEPQIAEVVAATLRTFGAAVDPVFSQRQARDARRHESSAEVLIVPAALEVGREERWRC